MSESQKLCNMSMRQKQNRTRATSHFLFEKKNYFQIFEERMLMLILKNNP